MPTFYHASKSRSGRVLWLLHELAMPFDLVRVEIPRRDGSGGPDPRNPHPDKKVPCLVHDGRVVSETAAILLYLTDLFADRGLGIRWDEPERGDYLTWLFWYAGVVEPVYLLEVLGVAEHPAARTTFRGRVEVEARLVAALERAPFLTGERFTAADILLVSPYLYFPEATPDNSQVRDWIARCTAREAYRRAQVED